MFREWCYMDKVYENNKNTIEELYNKLRNDQNNKEGSISEKRELTHKKLQEIKKILRESTDIIKVIAIVKDKLIVDDKHMVKPNYGYYSFLICSLILMFITMWKFGIVNSSMKNFSVSLIFIFISTFVLVNCIALYISAYVRKRKMYKSYIKNCKEANIINKEIINLVSKLLDNNIAIGKILPKEFFKYFVKEYDKTDCDKYIAFLCKNTKSLRKKCKNKNLKLYKGRYSRCMSIFLDVEDIENNYFESKSINTINECVERFLKNK